MRLSKIFSVKYLLCIVNLIFAITGVISLGIAVAVMLRYREFETILTERYFSLPWFLIATAVIIFIISSLGVYAAMSENFYVISSYAVLMLVILIFEMSVGIAGSALRNDAISDVRSTMQGTLLSYGSRIEITVMWDDMHREFECCGANGPSDWHNAYGSVPVSCCRTDYGQLSPLECDVGSAALFTTSCSSLLGAWVSSQAHLLAVSGVVLCSVQALLTAASGWIAWRSRFQEVELES